MGLGPSPLATTATNDVVDWSYVADLQPAPNMMFWPSQFPQLVVYWLKRAPEEEDVANADALISKVTLSGSVLTGVVARPGANR